MDELSREGPTYSLGGPLVCMLWFVVYGNHSAYMPHCSVYESLVFPWVTDEVACV